MHAWLVRAGFAQALEDCQRGQGRSSSPLDVQGRSRKQKRLSA